MGKYGQKDWFKRREIVKREWNGINEFMPVECNIMEMAVLVMSEQAESKNAPVPPADVMKNEPDTDFDLAQNQEWGSEYFCEVEEVTGGFT